MFLTFLVLFAITLLLICLAVWSTSQQKKQQEASKETQSSTTKKAAPLLDEREIALNNLKQNLKELKFMQKLLPITLVLMLFSGLLADYISFAPFVIFLVIYGLASTLVMFAYTSIGKFANFTSWGPSDAGCFTTVLWLFFFPVIVCFWAFASTVSVFLGIFVVFIKARPIAAEIERLEKELNKK